MRYSIVGMNFRNTERFVPELRSGADATLVREPNNVYDANAVAVWINGTHVGYVPKKQNQALAAFIDQAGQDMILNGTPGEVAKEMIGLDSDLKYTKFIPAKFIRSPNSGYPMVETS